MESMDNRSQACHSSAKTDYFLCSLQFSASIIKRPNRMCLGDVWRGYHAVWVHCSFLLLYLELVSFGTHYAAI